jgi:hypothetical protein
VLEGSSLEEMAAQSSLFVCSSFEELEVAVFCFWGEREFCVDFGGDAAAVAEDCLDFFEAESFRAEGL